MLSGSRKSFVVPASAPGPIPRVLSFLNDGVGSFSSAENAVLLIDQQLLVGQHYYDEGQIDQAIAALQSGLEAAKATGVDRIATDIKACAPGAVGESKRLVDHVAGRPIDHALLEETARWIARARVGEEGQEGVRAFLARRAPGWTQT